MKRRRKKRGGRNGNKGEQQAQQPPLQPAYPEADQNVPEEEVTPEPVEAEAEVEGASPTSEGGQRGRRKRRRGGAGRRPQRAETAVDAEATPERPAVPETPESAVGTVKETEEHPEPAAEASHPGVQAQPHVVHGQKRQPRGTVVLTIGLPGSGKTSWFRRRAITPLSSDLLRMMLFDDIAEQRYQDLVFSTLRYLLRARMIARMPLNYVDATNLSPRERRGWIKMAQEFGYEVHAVFFDVPVEVCAERNHRRGRIVPDDVMRRMAQKLRPPTFDEGFSKITVVRVKRQEPKSAEPVDNEVQDVAEQEGSGDESY